MRLVIALAMTGFALLLLVTASSARADFNSSYYSHESDPCTSIHIDPISLVLYGPNAYESRARYVLGATLGWSSDSSTGQYASSHGFCTRMDGESYSGCGICSRMHVRYNQTHHRDTKGR